MTSSEPILAYYDEYGYVWRYEHSDDEPAETLEAAIMIACDVVSTEAAKDGKTYVVALASAPSAAIYALPFGHPIISENALSILFQLTPDGRCFRVQTHGKH
jgi:hypothetical protein